MTRMEPRGLRGMVSLDRTECLRLLSHGVIGRVIYTAEAMPAARPVNYAPGCGGNYLPNRCRSPGDGN